MNRRRIAVLAAAVLLVLFGVVADVVVRTSTGLPPVRVTPWGCSVTVDWGTLTERQKTLVGDRLNECTAHYYPASDVRW